MLSEVNRCWYIVIMPDLCYYFSWFVNFNWLCMALELQGHWNYHVVLCYLNMYSKFQFVLIHLIMARIRKYNQTFKSNPIICLSMHSVYNTITWQEIRLSTCLANSWYSSSKAKRKARPIECHSSNAQFKFKQHSPFNREIKLTWFFKSIDRQNRSCWHFDDGCIIGEVMCDRMAN